MGKAFTRAFGRLPCAALPRSLSLSSASDALSAASRRTAHTPAVLHHHMALEWLSESDTIARESQKQRLLDNSSSLLESFSELLLRGGQVRGEVEQQVGEVRSSVVAAGLVQAADNLLELDGELRLSSVLTDRTTVGDEVAAVAASHNAVTTEGDRRLHRVAAEMRTALRELETHYYARTRLSGEASQS